MERGGLAAGLLAALLLAGAARAETPSAGPVDPPDLTRDATGAGLETVHLSGGPLGGATLATLSVSQNFGDRLSLTLGADMVDGLGGANRLEAVGLEAFAPLGAVPGTGAALAVKLAYSQPLHGAASSVDLTLIGGGPVGPVEVLVNLTASQPLTAQEGEGAMGFSYAAQATVAAGSRFRLGAQAFGALGTSRALGGRLAHLAGPMVLWAAPLPGDDASIQVEASYLAAIGAARDDVAAAVLVTVSFERRF